MDKITVTCVYCGLAYPDETPTHGAEILTDHIKVCEKHPMRKSELQLIDANEIIKNCGDYFEWSDNASPEDCIKQDRLLVAIENYLKNCIVW